MSELVTLAKELSDWLVDKQLSNEECIMLLKLVELGVTASFIESARKEAGL